jgi:hypothetical protein
LVGLAKFFDWRDVLVIVKPETFVGRQQAALKIFWRWKSGNPSRLETTVDENILMLSRRFIALKRW